MIDIPFGKALVVVEVVNKNGNKYQKCNKCYFNDTEHCSDVFCIDNIRKDGKTVIFRLVDWPGEEKE